MTQVPIEDQIAVQANAYEDQLVKDVAADRGPAPGNRKLTLKDELGLWNLELPVQFQAMLGMPPEMQMQQLRAVEHPDPNRVIELMAKKQFVEAEMVARYPYREKLIDAGREADDWRGKVEYAEHMKELSEKRGVSAELNPVVGSNDQLPSQPDQPETWQTMQGGPGISHATGTTPAPQPALSSGVSPAPVGGGY